MANYDEERHVQLAELRETRACRISEHHARHEEEHELCNIPPESMTIVQAERLSTLISLFGLDFHELGMQKRPKTTVASDGTSLRQNVTAVLAGLIFPSTQDSSIFYRKPFEQRH